MEAMTLGLLTLGIVAWWLTPRWRLRRALARPLPRAALDVLMRNVSQYRGMAPELQHQLQTLVRQFLHQKTFVGCAGLAITDEMRVTIAGQACLLLLNRHSRVYPGLDTILVYPDAFVAPRKEVDIAGVVHEAPRGLLGESWGDGRVLLSWQHVRRHDQAEPEAQNVVLHEFAHQLDSESGSNNGAPYLGSVESYRSWSAVLSRDFEALRRDAAFGHPDGVLDHYGASSPAEFFAVATESFFEKPWALAERHPALYGEFVKYYRVDPRDWSTAPVAAPEPPWYGSGLVHGQWQ
ncbi:MAG: zinc-dependent peptidase [Pseudomonadota bacterium]|nr:zinc-dependent peptidase [Pseudomonadota bacterium]